MKSFVQLKLCGTFKLLNEFLSSFLDRLLSYFNNFFKNHSDNFTFQPIVNVEVTPYWKDADHFKTHLLFLPLKRSTDFVLL